jgi:hypothetical protein
MALGYAGAKVRHDWSLQHQKQKIKHKKRDRILRHFQAGGLRFGRALLQLLQLSTVPVD